MRPFMASILTLFSSAIFVAAQQVSSATAEASSIAAFTATGSAYPACATVSYLLASYASVYPSATANPQLPADLAYECSMSAPIVKNDAINLVDGLTAFLQWQSTLAYLKNPPAGYLLEATDLLNGMADIRTMIQQGKFTSEVAFETTLYNLFTSAHDGHLTFIPDGASVFNYFQGLGPLVSISQDGNALPEIWSLFDLEKNRLDSFTPSPISTINGQRASDFLTFMALNGTVQYQDPDAMYNALFYNIGARAAAGLGAFQVQSVVYTGASTNATFSNGTTGSYLNYATTNFDFDGVHNGETFYHKFCNATYKALNSNSGSGSKVKEAAATTTSAPSSTVTVDNYRAGFPAAEATSPDGTLAGYFLNGTGYENTAVLSITSESEQDGPGVKKTLANFLALCRKTKKTNLIIDVSGNTGGAIILGYEFFKQLFPTLDAYAAGQWRATREYNILGSAIEPIAQSAIAQTPNNLTNIEDNAGYSIFDPMSEDDEYGVPFTSWSEYFGPAEFHGDNFTNLIRYNISNALYDIEFGVEVSGAEGEAVPSQPFANENIVLVSDGQCSSTCTTFSHLLKWQAKIKSVLIGGRPQNGPMQYIGGVKGKQVYGLPAIVGTTQSFYEFAGPDLIHDADQTYLKVINQLGQYTINRCSNPANANEEISVNIANSIAEGDETFTPLQFVYEAADCRLWWTQGMIADINYVWKAAADQAFGLNGTVPFAGCIVGSTNQPSSLSGNAALENGVQIENVTSFVPEAGIPTPSGYSTPAATSTANSPFFTGAATVHQVSGAALGLVGLVFGLIL